MPEIILVDTNILIDTGRKIPEAVETLRLIEERATLAISAMTEMELVVGLRNKNELRALDDFLLRFQVLPLNEQISNNGIELLRRFNLSHGLLIPDALIAATAISMNLGFVTKNIRDYRFISELNLLPYPNPFAIENTESG